MKFMNLPEEYANKDSNQIIIPISYEGNMSWQAGASKGSEAIIKASQELEYFDMDLNSEPYESGIFLTKTISPKSKEEDKAIPEITAEIIKIRKSHKNKFFVALGGDHSVTYGITKALDSEDKDYSVIIFDAHSDLRQSWNNSNYNHACVSYNIAKDHDMALIGIRSMDISEKEFLNRKENKHLHLIKAKEYSIEAIKKILPKLKKKVFISIDIDFFDPSFIRNTGTPEPGGFFWNDIINALELIFSEKKVIGADIVEFSPNINFESESYTLAKLTYKLFGFHQKENNFK